MAGRCFCILSGRQPVAANVEYCFCSYCILLVLVNYSDLLCQGNIIISLLIGLLLKLVLQVLIPLECLSSYGFPSGIVFVYTVANTAHTHSSRKCGLETEVQLGTTFIALYKLRTVLVNFTAH